MIASYINTLKEIYARPRNVVDSYVHTDHSDYQSPLFFMLIGAVIVVLLTSILVNFDVDVTSAVPEVENEQLQELSEQMFLTDVLISTQFLPLILILFLVPMLSVAGMLFLRSYTEGFFSLLILNSYLVGAVMIPLLLLIPLWSFSGMSLADPALNTNIPGVIVAAAGLWVYKNYFHLSDFMGWIRMLSAFITGYIMFILMKGLASSILGYIIFALRRIAEMSGNGG
ncbi:MAG: hypothetical protein EA391_09290 [Balneolaceae bacterium]|nr:MAG: hypothetical protein EA391_09290 [Balneolaceae bacterium]